MPPTLNQKSSLFGASKVRKQYRQQALSQDQGSNSGCLVLRHGFRDGVGKAGCLLLLVLEVWAGSSTLSAHLVGTVWKPTESSTCCQDAQHPCGKVYTGRGVGGGSAALGREQRPAWPRTTLQGPLAAEYQKKELKVDHISPLNNCLLSV